VFRELAVDQLPDAIEQLERSEDPADLGLAELQIVLEPGYGGGQITAAEVERAVRQP
jgi:hypothetical protein